jgi:hypothetical protein
VSMVCTVWRVGTDGSELHRLLLLLLLALASTVALAQGEEDTPREG